MTSNQLFYGADFLKLQVIRQRSRNIDFSALIMTYRHFGVVAFTNGTDWLTNGPVLVLKPGQCNWGS